jgi:hypothetical protein
MVQLDEAVASILARLPCNTQRTIQRGKETGLWLTILLSTVNGMEPLAQEFQDQLLLWYARSPGDLPEVCNGCGLTFNIQHAMTCKKGGLMIIHHNEIGDKLADINFNALTPSDVHNEPSIYPHGCAAERVTVPEVMPAGSSPTK